MRKLYTLKAGCILINKDNKKIGLVYRQKHNDYEFPKGHMESNENLKECAIRETAEECKREANIIQCFNPIQLKYRTKKGKRCKCYYYIAYDLGASDNTSTDTHELIWADFEEVPNLLTHPSTKKVWFKALSKIRKTYKI